MAADGSKRVAGHERGVAAIVDQQRHAALGHEPLQRLPRPRPPGPDRARAGCRRPVRRRRRRPPAGTASRAVPRRSGTPASSSTPTKRSCQRPDRRTNWRTGSASRNSLATTSSGRSAGRPASSSCQNTGRPGRAAACRSRRAGLVSTRWIVIAAAELGHHLRRSQGVGHQRATPRAEFHHGAAAGPAEIQPMLDQGQADQLAEQLAHLRRGDEIPGGAQGIAARIVALCRVRQGQGHVARDG